MLLNGYICLSYVNQVLHTSLTPFFLKNVWSKYIYSFFAVWNSFGVFRLPDSQIIHNRRFSEFQKGIERTCYHLPSNVRIWQQETLQAPYRHFYAAALNIPIQWFNSLYGSNSGNCIHMIELLFIISRCSPVVRFFFSLVSLSFVLPYWLPCTCRYTPVKASFLFSLASLLKFSFYIDVRKMVQHVEQAESKYLDSEKNSSFP